VRQSIAYLLIHLLT